MSTHLNDFDKMLVESIDEGIRSLFSQQVVDALRSNLKNKRAIAPDNLPAQLPTLHIVLGKYFGLGARTVERAIVRSLYSKLGLEFQTIEAYQLEDYVYNAKNRLRSTSS